MLAAAGWLANSWYKERLVADRRLHVETEVANYTYALSTVAHQCFAHLAGTQAAASLDIPSEKLEAAFATYAQGLSFIHQGVCDFSILLGQTEQPGETVADDPDILDDYTASDEAASIRGDIQEAIRSRHATLTPPYELRQGNLLWIAWLGVYRGDEFRGLASVQLRLGSILDEIAQNSQAIRLDMALRDDSGEILYGNRSVFAADPVLHRIEVPGGYWEMGGIPTGGWLALMRETLIAFQVFGSMVGLLIVYVTYAVANKHVALEETVSIRTAELTRVSEELTRDNIQRRLAEGRALASFQMLLASTRLMAEAQTRAALQERQRLARDLHDSVTQLLYGATVLGEAARRLAEAGDMRQASDRIVQFGQAVQQALKEMRLLVYELHPSPFEQDGFVAALQQRLNAVEKRAGLTARLVVEGETDLPHEVQEAMYRIAQEALNNVTKHAAATSVTVRLRVSSQEVALEVVDNGKGFDALEYERCGGIGLSSMRERAEALGGSLLIVSAPGCGTTVRAIVKMAGERDEGSTSLWPAERVSEALKCQTRSVS
ncbi:MAG: hypothetical protein HY675_14895 [Chloroflexi bacterium]|nr:hypothetical protein [Chloroflexota bacterium]